MRILRMWPIEIGVKARWLSAFWTGLFLVVGLVAQAQDPNNNYCVDRKGTAEGGFTLEKDRICLGETVRITAVQPNVVNAGYNYDYSGKGIPLTPTNITSYSGYTKPGSYTIIQVGSAGSGSIACKVVTVLAVDPVKFTVKLCSGRKAVVVPDETTLGQYDKYEVYWGDGVREQKTRAEMVAQPSHTYTNSGAGSSYVVTVQGLYNAPVACQPPKENVSIRPVSTPSAPLITELTTTSDNSISIKYQSDVSIPIQLRQKDASGIYTVTGQTGTGSGTFTVQTDAKQVQCFDLQYQDACDNSNIIKSDQVCSLVLNAKAGNKQNDLTWQQYSGSAPVRRYQIIRGSAPIGSTFSQTTTSYTDNNKIECGVQYCYSIEATITGTAQTIVRSAQTCVIGTNTEKPGNFGDILVTVQNNHPFLIAALPTTNTSTSYTMTISRASSPSGPFQVVGTASKNTFTDESADASAGSYCYQLTYQNNCGQVSAPSETVCSVFLSSQSPTGLDWTTGSPFSPGNVASYSLEVVDSVNNISKTIILGGNTHYEPDPNDPNLQSQQYRVVAQSADGVVSYSNFFTLRRDPKIFAPDAFTPNGDGVNDTFLIRGTFFDKFRLTIFSRWGEPIYTTTDRNQGWDGMVNGQPANAGQYMYRVEVIDFTDQKTVRNGALLLVR
ncbi:T9SS type B sorting domain-containing protein [Spirosoma endbachense]|uniref:T9SS type B sorting domain-containing protein n=1 Tax=Spirosoma endbachense TaxID=2666025 RepID=A0A6P1W7S4_9BACT|nr:gliding motility-associated C-terminal domain-containing protein [Spirosoma endbachense]QHW00619.1 T9SS type B sorting domain-containing protein [Spirosoma endbachense]